MRMSFKCTPQIIGLVRGEPKPGQKHRANGKAIIGEMGSERISLSETLDRTLSSKNIYVGDSSSGFATWDAMKAKADAYKTTFTDKNGVTRSRSLKSDSVIGFAVIFNPPYAECKNWTDEQYQKFYDDSWQTLCEIEPRVFRDENVRLTAEHFDEGIKDASGKFDRHQHRAGDCLDANGRYCGNLIDAKLLSTINKLYPSMMRDRGWEMEDLDTTDWDRYKTDTEYKARRKIKKTQSGKSVNKYIKDKLDNQLSELEEMTENVVAIQQDLDARESELGKKIDNHNQRVFAFNDKIKKMRVAAEMLDNRTSELDRRESALMREKEEANQRNRNLDEYEQRLIQLEDDLDFKEKEQQKKADEFQHREDSLEAQQRVLAERENGLKPSSIALNMLAMIQEIAAPKETKQQAGFVKYYIENHAKKLDKFYEQRQAYHRNQRQQFIDYQTDRHGGYDTDYSL